MKKHQRTTMICLLSGAAAMMHGALGLAQTAAPAAGANAPARDISMAVKGQQTLMLDGGAPTRIAIGDPDVADVKVLPASGKRAGSVLLYGKKPGTTQLQVWTGNNAAPQIWNVRVGGSVQGALASRGLGGGANVDIADGHAVVSGHAESQLGQIASATMAASAVGGEKNVVDMSTAGAGGVVQVEVKVVEVSRSVMKAAGISFTASNGPWSGGSSTMPASLGGALASGFSLFYDSNNFAARLRLLQTNGMARVLAEPTLVALTGQSARPSRRPCSRATASR
jgi:pilus assembly protein CpaC